MNEAEIRAATVGEPKVHDGTIDLADYDPAWPDLFTRESDRIRSMLGDVAGALEHVGSTSVPGLAAKPIIDIVLVVPDPANEAAYVPALEAIGYVLRIGSPTGTSIACSLGTSRASRSMCSRREARRSSACLSSETGSAGTGPTATSTSAPSATWPAGRGGTSKTNADAKTAVVNDIIARTRERGSDPGEASP
jgi:GrpB-like predicted nucleotidyltransferase (UPF0157 family)